MLEAHSVGKTQNLYQRYFSQDFIISMVHVVSWRLQTAVSAQKTAQKHVWVKKSRDDRTRRAVILCCPTEDEIAKAFVGRLTKNSMPQERKFLPQYSWG